ncbi:MAG: L,D-transpeptidase family protein [Candidatus Dormibacteria bacterium]
MRLPRRPTSLVLGAVVATSLVLGAPTQHAGASDFGGQLVAVRGLDGGLWVNPGGGWLGYGGQLLGAPAVARANGATVYVAVGTDHALWVRGDGVPWQPLSNAPTYCTDGPAALADAASSTFTVACRGADGALWYAQGPLTAGLPQVGGLTSLGGYLTSAPAIAVVEGQTTFAVDGGGSRVYTRTLTTPFSPTSWWCVDRPALGDAGGQAYFACHGTDNAMWYASDTGGGWSGTRSAGGRLVSGVSMAPIAGGAFLYAEGTDHAVWRSLVSSNGSAGGFIGMGGQVGDAVGAASFPGGDAFHNPGCRVPDNSLPTQGKVIIISIQCQVLSAYQDGRVVITSLTTTGRPARPTPTGYFHVLAKNHPWQMISGDPYGSQYWYPPSWVQYVLWFTYQGHGIHDASWEPNSALGPGSQYNLAVASHGCVHVNSTLVAGLYNWADRGTPVLIY